MIWRDLFEQPEEGVSHDPAIRKRTLLRKGELGPLCMFSQSRFAPGQECPEHAHESMDEVFFVEEGRGWMRVDGREIALRPGVCVVAQAGERHALGATGPETLVLTYFGLETAAAGSGRAASADSAGAAGAAGAAAGDSGDSGAGG